MAIWNHLFCGEPISLLPGDLFSSWLNKGTLTSTDEIKGFVGFLSHQVMTDPYLFPPHEWTLRPFDGSGAWSPEILSTFSRLPQKGAEGSGSEPESLSYAWILLQCHQCLWGRLKPGWVPSFAGDRLTHHPAHSSHSETSYFPHELKIN